MDRKSRKRITCRISSRPSCENDSRVSFLHLVGSLFLLLALVLSWYVLVVFSGCVTFDDFLPRVCYLLCQWGTSFLEYVQTFSVLLLLGGFIAEQRYSECANSLLRRTPCSAFPTGETLFFEKQKKYSCVQPVMHPIDHWHSTPYHCHEHP